MSFTKHHPAELL